MKHSVGLILCLSLCSFLGAEGNPISAESSDRVAKVESRLGPLTGALSIAREEHKTSYVGKRDTGGAEETEEKEPPVQVAPDSTAEDLCDAVPEPSKGDHDDHSDDNCISTTAAPPKPEEPENCEREKPRKEKRRHHHKHGHHDDHHHGHHDHDDHHCDHDDDDEEEEREEDNVLVQIVDDVLEGPFDSHHRPHHGLPHRPHIRRPHHLRHPPHHRRHHNDDDDDEEPCEEDD